MVRTTSDPERLSLYDFRFGDTANAGTVLGENPVRANSTGQPAFGPGPGMQTLDLATVRSFAIRESARFEVRGEAFNALSHSNFGTPNRFVNTPQFGTITEASTSGRELQVSARSSSDAIRIASVAGRVQTH
jgi:hypothetical protein